MSGFFIYLSAMAKVKYKKEHLGAAENSIAEVSEERAAYFERTGVAELHTKKKNKVKKVDLKKTK